MKEPLDISTQIRESSANAANAEDADVWRWFAGLVEERPIRWCLAGGRWLLSVDHRHVATDGNDHAIRAAKQRNDGSTAASLDRRKIKVINSGGVQDEPSPRPCHELQNWRWPPERGESQDCVKSPLELGVAECAGPLRLDGRA